MTTKQISRVEATLNHNETRERIAVFFSDGSQHILTTGTRKVGAYRYVGRWYVGDGSGGFRQVLTLHRSENDVQHAPEGTSRRLVQFVKVER